MSEQAGDATAALARLDEITRRLRRECPWDREQDERSIVPHTVEEAYELADAAASGDDAKLLDELGDVLFQVLFLSLLLEERGAGDLAQVADGMVAKLVRRHPHVFGPEEAAEITGVDEAGHVRAGIDADTAGKVLRNWDRIKREVEGRAGGEPFGDVPENLPALLYARKLQRRAASAGIGGVAAPSDAAPPEGAEEAIGSALFALVDLARRLRVDPELALRRRALELRELKDSPAQMTDPQSPIS